MEMYQAEPSSESSTESTPLVDFQQENQGELAAEGHDSSAADHQDDRKALLTENSAEVASIPILSLLKTPKVRNYFFMAMLVFLELALTAYIVWITHQKGYLKVMNTWFAYTALGTIIFVLIPAAARFPLYERFVGLDMLWLYHAWSVVVVLLCGLCHMVFTVQLQWGYLPKTIHDIIYIDLKTMFVPFTVDGPWGVRCNWGILLIYLMGLGALTAMLRRRAAMSRVRRMLSLPYKLWWPFHLLLWATIPVGLWHAKPHEPFKPKHIHKTCLLIFFAAFELIVVLTRIYRLIADRFFLGEWFRVHSVTALTTKDTALVLTRPRRRGLWGLANFTSATPGMFAMLMKPTASPFLNDPYPITIARTEVSKESLNLTFMIRATRGGKWSHEVAMYKPGMWLRVHGPYGVFTSDCKSSTIILAAGSGVAGFLPVVRQITADSAPVTMIWSIRSIAEAPYVDELFTIAQAQAKFKLILTVSRPDLEADTEPAPAEATVSHGRLDHHSMKAAVKHSGSGAVVYVCGTDDYLKSAAKLARQTGISRWKVNLIK
ncbi:putative ferric reductase [Carpediemonas membranifera]|uniref:Putative ferric reductase n=1 Tax=Carpediemonas membranifera TaxID=201153 RepID=A0A8J6DYQ1_9EUKA|nr:putative ferric reductase [Carpediemonas membranifera]|eukprot:KAG9389663.1 putative ferric reductase [Carpediemonas membranifera]